ncbi:nucleotidyltransferase [Bacillus sp. FJAT-49732]|uniref:tRNA(Met) cytidine acetate ligase n=1 Tax=Lederbergia citrisecunda TaxID=2833583 RepID=A0A942YK50_9BACI|nr:nucleotidyltransferase [Lederbergia citrisecunda]MBS4198844.1 nucleotidyltransferase [Lederbergia citrisecunda]
MNSVGIVAEYNPFHNGHRFQFQSAKKLAQSDIAIAVMSGNFLQRGEPALVNKWTRTKMALQAGVDIVIELPYAFAVQNAEIFAYGAVSLLNAIGCRNICFGSESGDIHQFYETVQFINDHKDEYDTYIRKFIKQGISYPSALSSAFKELKPNGNIVDLTKPNNILGYHYMTAGEIINTSISFHTVKRKSAEHHDEYLSGSSITSATSIRKSIHFHSDFNEIREYVPNGTFIELHNYHDMFGQFHSWEQYWSLLQYKILSMTKEELEEIYDVSEGLENRLIKASQSSSSFEEFMTFIKTKRYTWTRLQRTCIHILTNTKKQTIQSLDKNPQYIRLLGMNERGREYVRTIKKELQVPLISKVSGFQNDMLELDLKASNIYALALSEPERSILLKQEFAQPPILYENKY